MNYSKYQQKIFDVLEMSNVNFLVEAVAGSGKTTTMEHGVRDHVPMNSTVAVLAFNKHIADSAAKRMPFNVTSRTISSLLWEVARSNEKFIKLDDEKIDKILRFDVLKVPPGNKEANREYYKVLYPLKRIIALIKAAGDDDLRSYDRIIETHAIEPPEVANFRELVAETLRISIAKTKVYDFNDQIYMPFVKGMELPSFDLSLIDEFQDLNPVQIKVIHRMGGRKGFFGDRYQSIYGFRGADPDAIDLITTLFDTSQLPLSICYRCAKSIVVEAQKFVPHIEYSEFAEDGIVDRVKNTTTATPGDFILCRTTAPLVKSCLNYIRSNQRAYVLGKEIGDDLIAFCQNVCSRDEHVNTFREKLEAYHAAKVERLTQLEKTYELAQHNDRYDTVAVLLESPALNYVSDLQQVIKSLFEEDADGIKHMTAHKSKGLEADRVFILRPDLLPHPSAKLPWQQIQERNLGYVAGTRARKELYYVDP